MDKESVNSNIAFIIEAESGLQQALLGHCLSLYLLELVNNTKQMTYWYQGKESPLLLPTAVRLVSAFMYNSLSQI